MAKPAKGQSSSINVLTTLTWVRKHEFKPVPLQPQSKAAISREYADKNYVPPSDQFWRDNDYGLGVVTGPAAKGPVDIDLDCHEAIFFARRFLPTTPAIFGRASKPASHFLYRVAVPELQKFALLDPLASADIGATVIELRADGGHQTVLPGSIHQDTGEPIEWETLTFPDVPVVDPDVLIEGVKTVGMATLITRYLWLDGQRNEVVKSLSGLFYYLDWTVDEVIDVIQAVMDFTGDDDKTRIITVKNTFKKAERGGKITGATSLRKLLGDDKIVDRILDWAGSPTVNLLQEYNERFAVVSVEGKFRIVDTDVEPGEAPIFLQKEDFLNFMGADYTEIDGKRIAKPRLWLASERRRTYRSVDFLPGLDDSTAVLNLWTGWATRPDPASSCAGWLELLNYICDNDALAEWMLHWFANIVREPRIKSLTAPVLIGVQGAGKSLLTGYFGRVLGPAYTVITNEEHIYGRFNRHLATTLLLHSEEALYGGEKKHRGIIKSLITDEFRMFEPKGIDARQVRNYLRLILTSNEAHAAPAESNDRRFTIIDMAQRKAPQKLVTQVVKEMTTTGPAALFHYLQEMDYDPNIPRTNIKNEALQALQGINLEPLASWWFEVLNSGEILPEYLSWAQKPSEHPWPDQVSSTALYAFMSIRLRERGVRTIPNETLFAIQLSRFIQAKLARQQRLYSNPLSDEAPQVVKLMSSRQSTITNLPDLTACRQAFEVYTGHAYAWPDEPEAVDKPAYARY